eukprot:COSAG06_NODE_21_length_33796_cov_70.184853_23_plen_88_part_00
MSWSALYMIEMWQLWVGGACRYGQNVFNTSTDGVCQETCRDFGHMQMGMASAHYTAETAFIQGVDLCGWLGGRIANTRFKTQDSSLL